MKSSDKEALEIVFCDNHLVVAKKRANLLTQPDNSSNISLEDLVKEWVKEKFQKKGSVYLHAVHRLDKAVSGLVLFAKTSKALARFNEMMRKKLIVRGYMALVEGKMLKKEGTLEHYLVHEDFYAKVVDKSVADAQKALLHYRVLAQKEQQTLLYIVLDTGRYHQIRAQLSAIGHPIIGDAKYGSKTDQEEILLHGSHLEFLHPVTKEELVFDWEPSWARVF